MTDSHELYRQALTGVTQRLDDAESGEEFGSVLLGFMRDLGAAKYAEEDDE